MSKYNILWVDDDIDMPELRADKTALIEKECNIIGFNTPDTFLDYINDNRNKPKDIDCIIIDLSMPLTDKIKDKIKDKIMLKKTLKGLATGHILLELIKDSQFKQTLITIYTITDNDEVKEYCKNNINIHYKNKLDYLSDEFADEIIKLIQSYNILIKK